MKGVLKWLMDAVRVFAGLVVVFAVVWCGVLVASLVVAVLLGVGVQVVDCIR